MDLSAGGLAPTPRDGASSSQAVVDPLDAFLSPLGSPGLPTDAAAQAALRALRGEESESESSRRPSDSVGGRLEPSRAHASYNEDLKIKGSAGSAGKTKQESSSASKSRSVANTYGRKSYSSRYFDAPERSASQDEPAANDFEAEHALTATQNGAPDSVVPSKSQQGASSGPSQVGGADGDNLSVASGGGGRRYTLTAFRHLARLDKFASEEGRHSPAPEQSTVDEERMDLESEFSVGTGGRARSGYDPTDDGMSVRSGYKRAASEMDRGEYEEEDEFGRYRRSDTPFNESEYPGDDAASSVRSIGPSRTYGRSHRSRSVAFSQRSLYSERSQEEDGDEDSIAPSGDMQDSGFYAAGEGESEKPIVTEPEDENGGVDSEGLLYEGDDDDDAGVASHHAAENDNNEPQYFDFDPLMPMGSIYVGTKHPHLAYAAALAQAAKDADTGAEGGQGPQVEQQVDQENVAPSESEARAQGQKQKTTTTERKETSESVLEKWNAARAGTVERFGGLMSRVDQLLEGKIRRHEKLDSTLTAHQSTLNERYQQLRQTKAGLRHWGNQLFTSLKTAEQESDAAAVATAAAAAAAAKEGEIAMPTEQAEVAGGQHGGKATATDLTSNGEAEATPAEAPVTSVDES